MQARLLKTATFYRRLQCFVILVQIAYKRLLFFNFITYTCHEIENTGNIGPILRSYFQNVLRSLSGFHYHNDSEGNG